MDPRVMGREPGIARGGSPPPRAGMGQAGAVQPQGGGEFSIAGQRYVARDYFSYEEDFAGVGAGQSASGEILIQADSDFIWQKALFFADVAGAAQEAGTLVFPLMTVQIQDTGSGRLFFEQPVPVPSAFGVGALPFILPVPRLFLARSTVLIEVANFSNATTYNLRLTFAGTKAYPMGSAP